LELRGVAANGSGRPPDHLHCTRTREAFLTSFREPTFVRPPPRGGGGMRAAHDGGVGAGPLSAPVILSRHPLSHLLGQMPAPPSGGARSSNS
jgi:hypothetical protein